ASNDRELVRLPGLGLPTQLLRFSPDSRYLAAKYKLGSTNELIVWDWRSRSAVLRLPQEINRQALDFSPDSRRIALGQTDGRMQVYALQSGTLTTELSLQLPTHRSRPPN